MTYAVSNNSFLSRPGPKGLEVSIIDILSKVNLVVLGSNMVYNIRAFSVHFQERRNLSKIFPNLKSFHLAVYKNLAI